MDLQHASREAWDVIVVGTGVGGATLGYALAQKGLRVLFCEKGRSGIDGAGDLAGNYVEQFLPSPEAPYAAHQDILARAGRYWEAIDDRSHLLPHEFVPFIGWGAGGSSALFGMALERFFPDDFSPRALFENHIATSLPEAWPITYEDLLPHYEAAERLYRVRGTPDPLRAEKTSQQLLAPPSLTPVATELFAHVTSKGLHPYQLPMACEYVPECRCCQGYLCAKKCKNHSGRICLEPAIHQHGAALLDACEVLKLDATGTTVTGVHCRRNGETYKLQAKRIVLAAGALVTPTLLLRSSSADWPNGLANRSGLVGRNLMRHFVDLYLVDPSRKQIDNRFKELAFNDYYCFEGQKLGTVQSFGRLPPVPVMARSLSDEAKLPGLARLLGLVAPLAKGYMTKLVERTVALASIVEDPPYADNRVIPTAGGNVRINYQVHAQDMARIKRMRELVQAALSPYPTKVIKQAHNNHRIAHACGTCRFGSDPSRSVLDPSNRAHGLDNLFVVDASFFPSSAGTNPALTIAANALRVAENILAAA